MVPSSILLLIVIILTIIIEIACSQHSCCNCLETASTKRGNTLCRSSNECANIICNIGDPRFTYNPDLYCCQTQWDNICVNEAQIICDDTITESPTSIPTPQPTYAFESCIDQFPLFNGAGSLSIEIDHIFKKLMIKIRGPSTKWFGVGFGKHMMENTYSIITSANTISTEERLLGNHQSGAVLTSTFEDIINVEINGYREISCIRNYNNNIYDFTDWFDCNHKWLKIISALGSDLTFNYHVIKNNTASLFSCLCDTKHPTDQPTSSPTTVPTENPTMSPSVFPTHSPSTNPTIDPSINPTSDPTKTPSIHPTANPTINPSTHPTKTPTIDPTVNPTTDPTIHPTRNPSKDPTLCPTNYPTSDPTINPTKDPSDAPTMNPTNDPSQDPTLCPTNHPTLTPTYQPSLTPITIYNPSNHPTTNPPSDTTVDPTASSNSMKDQTIIVTLGLDFWWFLLLILILPCLCIICCIFIIFYFKRKYHTNDTVAIPIEIEMAKKYDPETESDKEEMKGNESLPYMQVKNDSNHIMGNGTMIAIIDTVNNPNYPELQEDIKNSIVNMYEAGHQHIETMHDEQISNYDTMIIKLSPQPSETMDDVDFSDNMSHKDIEQAFE